MNIAKKLRELDKEARYDLDLECSYYDELTFDEFMENVETGIYQTEIIYYGKAMAFLTEEDNSLSESLEIADELGYETANINSELLATLLLQSKMQDELSELYDELEGLFTD